MSSLSSSSSSYPSFVSSAFLSPSALCSFLSHNSLISSSFTNHHRNASIHPRYLHRHLHRRTFITTTCISNAEFPDLSPPSPPPESTENSTPSNENGNGNGNGASSNENGTTIAASESASASAPLTKNPIAPTLAAIFKFTRPHTIRGTILAAFAGCARALLESPLLIDWSLLPRAFIGLAALLFGNAFIVGINQIYDVRLDRINKPFLPLASRELSRQTAWMIVVSSAILGLLLVKFYFSPLIFGLYAFGMAFGTLYSVPPFRFKRYPVLAAITISCVRGFLLNFGVYHATKNALRVPFTWSPPITFLAIFMSIFATVIALAKDLPDIEGDRAGGIPTFASTVGPHKMVGVVYGMLILNYAGAVLTAGLAPVGVFNRTALGAGHLLLGMWLIKFMTTMEPSSRESINQFYAFIWKLFYAEYLLFPFI